ncbi:MAG: Mth938-like domain-containing protein [Proteobacteria bacterium]|nr:Mth938-like domain-containing protein [Pseudomonadota bacterium]
MSVNLTRQTTGSQPQIQKYGSGGFRVANADYRGSIIVHPGGVIPWAVTGFADLSLETLAPVLALASALDVCLIGCGEKLLPIPLALRTKLKEAGVPHDPMDTGAACRTYNVLAGEGRAVAAALIAV